MTSRRAAGRRRLTLRIDSSAKSRRWRPRPTGESSRRRATGRRRSRAGRAAWNAGPALVSEVVTRERGGSNANCNANERSNSEVRAWCVISATAQEGIPVYNKKPNNAFPNGAWCLRDDGVCVTILRALKKGVIVFTPTPLLHRLLERRCGPPRHGAGHAARGCWRRARCSGRRTRPRSPRPPAPPPSFPAFFSFVRWWHVQWHRAVHVT